MLLLLFLFFRFTKTGLAMRAAAQNPVSARLCGIPVGRMLAIGWGLAAGHRRHCRHHGGAGAVPRSLHDVGRAALRIRRRAARRNL
jgi:hypothetical protein